MGEEDEYRRGSRAGEDGLEDGEALSGESDVVNMDGVSADIFSGTGFFFSLSSSSEATPSLCGQRARPVSGPSSTFRSLPESARMRRPPVGSQIGMSQDEWGLTRQSSA